MTDVPLSVILSWPEPNFDNPETHGKGFLAGSVILTVAGCVAAGLRLWARFGIVRKPGPDDYLIIIAVPTSIGLTISTLLLVYRYGSDRHNWDTDYAWIVPYSLISWIGFQLYLLNQGLIKVSILFLYRHILLRSFSRVNQYINWALIIIVTAYTLAFYFLNVFQCDPVDAVWLRLSFSDPYLKKWTCIDPTYTFFVASIISTVFDFIVAAFPVLFLRQLHLPKRQKWLLVVVFGLVFVVCAAGVMRILSLNKLLYNTYDKTWYGYYHHLWTVIEIWLALICACAPVLKPLVRRHIGSSEDIGNLLSASWSKIRNLDLSSGSRSKQQLSKDSVPATQTSMVETRHNVTLNSNFDELSPNSHSPTANGSITALPALPRPSRTFPSTRPRPRSPQPLPPLMNSKTATVTTDTSTTSNSTSIIPNESKSQPRVHTRSESCRQLQSQSQLKTKPRSRPFSQSQLDDQREAYSRFRFRDSLTSSRPLSSLSMTSVTVPSLTRFKTAVNSSGDSNVIDFQADVLPRQHLDLYSPDRQYSHHHQQRLQEDGIIAPTTTPKTAPSRVESLTGSGNGSVDDGSISERIFTGKSFYYP